MKGGESVKAKSVIIVRGFLYPRTNVRSVLESIETDFLVCPDYMIVTDGGVAAGFIDAERAERIRNQKRENRRVRNGRK